MSSQEMSSEDFAQTDIETVTVCCITYMDALANSLMIARRCQFVLLSRVEISKKVIRIVTICRHMSNTAN